VNIWENQGSLTTRALALQGLGRAAQHGHVKQALADWEVLKDIAKEVKGKGEVSSDLTRWAAAKALEDIGYSLNDLQHLEGGGFTEPLDRIRREIRDRKLAEINRIQRLNTRRETTAEYERNLEFWVYGPVEELFAGNDHSPNYQESVKDVISELQGRGVYLGLRSSNLLVQAEALLQAGPIFEESAEIENFLYPFLEDFLYNSNQEIGFRINAAEIIHTARDLNRRLKTLSKLLLEEKNPKLQEVVLRQAQSLFKQSAETEDSLYWPLEEFLHDSNHEISLRINAAEILNTATDLSKRLKTLSKLLLEEKNTKLQEWTLGKAHLLFKQSAETEDSLYESLEDFLYNSNRETSLRINAADIINTARDLSRKLKTLSQLLLEETDLRNTAVRLLNPYKQELARVESDAYTVLDALSFEYKLDKHEPKSLTIPEIENRLSSANQLQSQITQKFAAAMIAAASLANKYTRSALVLKQFLQNQELEIGDWIQKLNNQKSQTANEQSKIESNQLLLKKHFSSASLRLIFYGSAWQEYLAQVDKYKKITNTDYYNNFNYNHCQQQLSELLTFKEEIISDLDQRSKKGGDDVEGLFSLMSLSILPLWGYFTYLSFIYLGIGVSILVFFLSPILLIMIILIILIIYAFTIGVKIGQIVTRLNKQWRV